MLTRSEAQKTACALILLLMLEHSVNLPTCPICKRRHQGHLQNPQAFSQIGRVVHLLLTDLSPALGITQVLEKTRMVAGVLQCLT